MWNVGDEWDDVIKSSQLIYISSGLKTDLKFLTTAPAHRWLVTVVSSCLTESVCAKTVCRGYVFKLCLSCV